MTSVLTHPSAAASTAGDLALHFAEPMPGFELEREYTLSAIDPDGILFAMRSVQDPSLRFVLSPAECFFDGYHPAVAEAVAESLGAPGPDDVRVLLVLTIGTGLSDATANLRAPIAVAASSGAARQILLEDEGLPMQQPLFA